MLLGLAEVFAAVTAETPLVLVLEDLHWSDYATLDLVAFLARRRESTRLLLIGTDRPGEVLAHEHPLRMVKADLQRQGYGVELPLALLSEAAVAEYIQRRFAGCQFPTTLARMIHRPTDGNPLFVVSLVDDLVRQGVVTASHGQWTLRDTFEAEELRVSEGLREMLTQQLDRLTATEQRLLEAASAAGVIFTAAAVAAGLDEDVVTVEEQCEGLARRQQFLRVAGMAEWPDGTVSGRYEFIHALYHNVVYQRLAAARRVRLHQRLGTCLEAAYGARVREIAAELAEHFGRGHVPRQAVQYLQQAAENAAQRSAPHEVISLLTRALALLDQLPDTTERTARTLTMHVALGGALRITKGYSAPEVQQVYSRAHEMGQQVEDTFHLFPVLWGLWGFYTARAEFQTAYQLGERLFAVAQHLQDPAYLIGARQALGATLLQLGELRAAHTHLEQGIACYDPTTHRTLALLYGQDPGIACRSFDALVLWQLGYPERALVTISEALTLAQDLAHPFSRVFALAFATWIEQCRGETQRVVELTAALQDLCAKHGFPQWLAAGLIWRGWALAHQSQAAEGMVQMQQGLEAFRRTGARMLLPYFCGLLAQAHGAASQVDAGMGALADGLTEVEKHGERFYAAELHRLKGEWRLQAQDQEGRSSMVSAEVAEACFQQAIAIARRQGAKAWELRAAISLGRLWQCQGKLGEAQQLLAGVYGWFTEGFGTVDLQAAQVLLQESSG